MGFPTLKVNIDSTSPELFISKDDKMFKISLSISATDNQLNIEYAKESFNQILSTFRFVGFCNQDSDCPQPDCAVGPDYKPLGNCPVFICQQSKCVEAAK